MDRHESVVGRKFVMGRRSFIKRAGLMALPSVLAPLSVCSSASASPLKARLTIDTNGPARLEVRDAAGGMFQPAGAVIDPRSASPGIGKDSPYWRHFTSPGTVTLELPPGRYTVIDEKGLEFERIESAIDVTTGHTMRLAPPRWIHMASKGWWSADFHLHRPPEQAELLLKAEDLNLGVFFTMWNDTNLWEGKEPPIDSRMRIDAQHVATLMNAEDERGGGAWMMHNLKKPLALASAKYWYPQGRIFVDQAKAMGAWFDSEKPIWWEVPVMAAIAPMDSMGLVHNHYNQYGMVDDEAWGRPRDQKIYPGRQGFSNYSQSLYHRFLNLGMRLPASAGSASGVLPGPPGYNRVYAFVPGGFSVEGFYSALKAGKGFVTNGPILSFTVNGKTAGDTVEVLPGRPLNVRVEAQAREPMDKIEVIANGRVVADAAGSKLESEIAPKNHTWLAARCTLKTAVTVRLAHTSPIFLRNEKEPWNAAEDKIYFLKWVDDLIAETEADKKRFDMVEQKNEVLAIYKTARNRYLP
jgi:hypothetical protein